MNYSCYVLDDEFDSIELLTEYINVTAQLTLVGCNTNPIMGLKEVRELKPDVLFLDVEMPYLSGMEFSELINTNITVIFTTAHPDFAIRAFELKAFDYLLKPILFSRFQKTISRLIPVKSPTESQPIPSSFFFIKSENKGRVIKVDFTDINYVESNSNYVMVCTSDDKHNTYLTLKEFMEFLPKQIFTRVHKCFIININKINYVDGNQIFLKDKTVLQLGTTYRDSFFRVVNQLLIKSSR